MKMRSLFLLLIGFLIPIVSLCNGVPKIVETKFENGFKISPQELEKNISSKTNGLLLIRQKTLQAVFIHLMN